MAFLYATIDKEEKKGKGDLKQEQQHDDIIDEMRRAENESQAKQQAHRLELEHERQVAQQKAEFDQKTKENNDKLDEMYREVATIERVIRHSRLQSRRLS